MNQQNQQQPVHAEPTGSAFRTSATVAGIFGAFIAAQAEIGAAVKDSENPHFKSRYADLASVWSAFGDSFAKHKLAVMQAPAIDGNHVRVVTRIIHSSGEWIESEVEALARDQSPQAIGSVITYLRRYGASALIGVVQDDDDGNAGLSQGAPPQNQRSRPTAPAPAPQTRTHAAPPPPPPPEVIPFADETMPGLKGDGTLGVAWAAWYEDLLQANGKTTQSLIAAINTQGEERAALMNGSTDIAEWSMELLEGMVRWAKAKPRAGANSRTAQAKANHATPQAEAA